MSDTARTAQRAAYYLSISLAIIIIITWTIAMFSVPVSGPFCPGDCIEYPYTEGVSRFPHDYYWMYSAMLLMLVYTALLVYIHRLAPENKKVFSHMGLLFGVIATTVLLINYFVQVTIIQPALLNGETVGIALWTQFNPHGLFIALEELGYIMMAIAALPLAFIFSCNDIIGKWIRRSLQANFILAVLALVIISVRYGIHREYYFEVAIISINWLILIIVSFLMACYYKQKFNQLD